jgi:hypothetical protein
LDESLSQFKALALRARTASSYRENASFGLGWTELLLDSRGRQEEYFCIGALLLSKKRCGTDKADCQLMLSRGKAMQQQRRLKIIINTAQEATSNKHKGCLAWTTYTEED